MPGKFEGEPEYAERFYEMATNSDQDDILIDDTGRQVDLFVLQETDKHDYPEIAEYNYLVLFEDENGFVYTKIFMTETALKDYLEALGIDPDEIEV